MQFWYALFAFQANHIGMDTSIPVFVRPVQAEIRSLHGFASLMLEKSNVRDRSWGSVEKVPPLKPWSHLRCTLPLWIYLHMTPFHVTNYGSICSVFGPFLFLLIENDEMIKISAYCWMWTRRLRCSPREASNKAAPCLPYYSHCMSMTLIRLQRALREHKQVLGSASWWHAVCWWLVFDCEWLAANAMNVGQAAGKS